MPRLLKLRHFLIFATRMAYINSELSWNLLESKRFCFTFDQLYLLNKNEELWVSHVHHLLIVFVGLNQRDQSCFAGFNIAVFPIIWVFSNARIYILSVWSCVCESKACVRVQRSGSGFPENQRALGWDRESKQLDMDYREIAVDLLKHIVNIKSRKLAAGRIRCCVKLNSCLLYRH